MQKYRVTRVQFSDNSIDMGYNNYETVEEAKEYLVEELAQWRKETAEAKEENEDTDWETCEIGDHTIEWSGYSENDGTFCYKYFVEGYYDVADIEINAEDHTEYLEGLSEAEAEAYADGQVEAYGDEIHGLIMGEWSEPEEEDDE